MPFEFFRKVYRDLTKYPLPDPFVRLADPWMGCAVNIGTENGGVCTQGHRDLQNYMFGLSCLCPFGIFEGGEVVMWEIETVLELRRGDILFFPDHLITHSNLEAKGARHSVVAFTERGVWGWVQKTFKFADKRIQATQAKQKSHRGHQAQQHK
jgi:hypothetical protein